MAAAGTNIFCLDGQRGSQLVDYVESTDDGNFVKIMQESNKYIMYALLQSWMGDNAAANDDLINANLNPWWKTVVYSIDGVVIGLTVVSLGLYVYFDFFKGRKSKEEKKEQ